MRAFPVDVAACLHQRAGWAQCAAALLCAAQVCTSGPARAAVLDAARREFDKALARTLAFLAAPRTLDAAAVRAHALALASEIGDVDQRSSGGPDTLLDELLRPEARADAVELPLVRPMLPVSVPPIAPAAPTDGLCDAVVTLFARRVRLPAHALDLDRPFSEYGIDSVDALELVLEIEEALGVALDPTVLWNYPTLNQLLRHVAPARTAAAPAVVAVTGAAAIAPVLSGEQLLDELRKELASDEL